MGLHKTLIRIVIPGIAVILTASPSHGQEQPIPPLFGQLGISDFDTGLISADTGVVNLAGAVARVLTHNPAFQAVRAQTGVASGRLKQAGVYANPELSVDVEDFARQSTGGPSQTTVGIAQPLLLWGKRGARRDAARTELSASYADVNAIALELYSQTAESFAALLGAEQTLSYAEERLGLAKEIESAVQVKLGEGAVPKSELLRAQASTGIATAERDRAQAEVDRQRIRLSALWNGEVEVRIEGDFSWVDTIPRYSDLEDFLGDNPTLISLEARRQSAQASLRLARALSRPDIGVGAGYRRLHDSGDNAFVAGLTLSLPFFDRNQGGIIEAASQVEVAQAELESAKLLLRRELRSLSVTLENQTRELSILNEQILPATDQAFREIDEAYRLGRSPYINVLDAQRTLAETQSRLVEVRVSRAQTAAQIESLIGHRLDSVGR